MKLKILLLVLLSLNLLSESWTASELIAQGIKQNKQIYFGYDRELEEKPLMELYKALGEKEVRKLGLTRFKVTESLTSQETFPYYIYLLPGGLSNGETSISNDQPSLDSEFQIFNPPQFSSDDSHWLIITDEVGPELKDSISTLKLKSEIYGDSKIWGLFQQKSAFKIIDSKSYGKTTSLTLADINDLKLVYQIYKTEGSISKPKSKLIKSIFGKALITKLNQN